MKMSARSTSHGRRSELRKGAWSEQEDELLRKFMEQHGAVRWSLLPERAGLNRCRKSCRLRWLNYLCPSIKRGEFEDAEVDLIIRLHKLLGNRWSLIAGRLPGRTANDVKNYWNTHLKRQLFVERAEKEASTTCVEVLKPKPLTIPWNWKWSKEAEASPGKHHQEESDIAKRPPSSHNNSTCTDSVIEPETPNLSMSDIEVGMTEEVHTRFETKDCGSFGDGDLLLEGFGGWEDVHPDISLWFESV